MNKGAQDAIPPPTYIYANSYILRGFEVVNQFELGRVLKLGKSLFFMSIDRSMDLLTCGQIPKGPASMEEASVSAARPALDPVQDLVLSRI